jgi:PTH1 family peptidyl-tRNA hydrolase
MFIIVGLGNPGEEYTNTRHNTGRIMLDAFRKEHEFEEWEQSGKYKALISLGKVGKEKVMLIEPETFMNKSGLSLGGLVSSKKKAEQLVVIHDELDIPFGKFKISFNKSSGGHRGVESIIKTVKTEGFIRVRVGISPATPTGKLKKPMGEKAVGDFILGEFKKGDEVTLKKVCKKVSEALTMIVMESREKAMGEFNKQ